MPDPQRTDVTPSSPDDEPAETSGASERVEDTRGLEALREARFATECLLAFGATRSAMRAAGDVRREARALDVGGALGRLGGAEGASHIREVLLAAEEAPISV